MNKSNPGGGVGILTVLAVVFIVLRLIPTGYPSQHQHLINWSWWVVLLPIWGPLASMFIAFMIGFVGVLVYRLIKH